MSTVFMEPTWQDRSVTDGLTEGIKRIEDEAAAATTHADALTRTGYLESGAIERNRASGLRQAALILRSFQQEVTRG